MVAAYEGLVTGVSARGMVVTPEDAERWLPVIRDYLALVVGFALGIVGIIIPVAALASAGFGLAGIGIVGRIVELVLPRNAA